MKLKDICYDKKSNKYKAIKTQNDTIYYIGAGKICARCKNYIIGYLALSRRDNKTEICSNCGNLEALEDFIRYKKGEKQKWILKKQVEKK